MKAHFQVTGSNAQAPFTLKVHRGDGMALIAMNWKRGKPPRDLMDTHLAAGFTYPLTPVSDRRHPNYAGGADRFGLRSQLAHRAPRTATNSLIFVLLLAKTRIWTTLLKTLGRNDFSSCVKRYW